MKQAHDYSALKWLKGELDETIREARRSLEEYVEGSGKAELLDACAAKMHQVHGILQMVQLQGAAQLAEEMELVSKGLASGQLKDSEQASEALVMGMIRLPDYLEELQSGGQDSPMQLLPILNELRTARKAEQISEMSVFAPVLDRLILAGLEGGEDNPKMAQLAKAIRPKFQKAMVAWVKNVKPPVVLKALRDMMVIMEKSAGRPATKRLFRIVRAALHLPTDKSAGKSGAAIKKLVAKTDGAFKIIAVRGEAPFAKRPPVELLRHLLHLIARSDSQDVIIKKVKKEFGLEGLMGAAGGGKKGFAPNRELLRSLGDAIGADLLSIKDSLDLFIRSRSEDPEELHALAKPLRKVADTLGMVGQGGLRQRLMLQAERLAQATADGGVPDDTTLMEVAGDILFVETSLENLSAVGGGSQYSEQPAEEEGVDQAHKRLNLPPGEYEKLVESVIHEVGIDMRRSKEAILSYIESPESIHLLSEVPGRFHSMAGAFDILRLVEVSTLLRRISGFVTAEVIRKRTPLDQERLNTFADAITSIEYFMESVAEGRGVQQEILSIAEEALDQLKAVDVRELPEAEAVAEAATPAPTLEDVQQAAREEAAAPAAEKPALEEVDPEILEIFVEEAREVLDTIREYFPKWRNDREDRNALVTFRRSFHTLKGSGRLVGANTIGEMAWSVENLLNRIIDETVRVSPEILELLDQAVDMLPGLIDAQADGGVPETDVNSLMEHAFKLAEPDNVREAIAKADKEAEAQESGFYDEAEATLVEEGEPQVAPPEAESAAQAPAPGSGELEEVDPEILEIFLEESKEVLETIEDNYPRWHKDHGNKDALSVVRRSFHTLKGSGRMVGAMTIGELAWSIENLLNKLLEGEIEPSDELLRVLDETIENLPGLIECQEKGEAPNVDVQALMDRAFLLADPNYVPEPPPADAKAVEPTEADQEEAAAPGAEIEPAGPAPEAALQPEPEPEPEPATETAAAEPETELEEVDPEILEIFVEEAREVQETLEDQYPAWRNDAANEEALTVVRRSFHTLKGSGRMVGALTIGELAWSVEDMLNRLLEGKIQVSTPMLELLDHTIEALPELVDCQEQGKRPKVNVNALQERAKALAEGDNVEEPPPSESQGGQGGRDESITKSEAEGETPQAGAAQEPTDGVSAAAETEPGDDLSLAADWAADGPSSEAMPGLDDEEPIELEGLPESESEPESEAPEEIDYALDWGEEGATEEEEIELQPFTSEAEAEEPAAFEGDEDASDGAEETWSAGETEGLSLDFGEEQTEDQAEGPAFELDEGELAPEGEAEAPALEFDEGELAPEDEAEAPSFELDEGELAPEDEAEAPSFELDEGELAPEDEAEAPSFELDEGELAPEDEAEAPSFELDEGELAPEDEAEAPSFELDEGELAPEDEAEAPSFELDESEPEPDWEAEHPQAFPLAGEIDGSQQPALAAAYPPPDIATDAFSAFIEEARDEVDMLAEYIPVWQSDPADAETRDVFLQSFKTIQDKSGPAGVRAAEDLSGAVVGLLDGVSQGSVPMSQEVLDAVKEALGQLAPMVDQVAHERPLEADPRPLIGRVQALATGGETAQEAVGETPESATPERPMIEMDTTLQEIFTAEAQSHISTLEGFLTGVRGEAAADRVPTNGVCRAFHTLHGSALLAEVGPIAELSASLEYYVKALIAQDSPMDDRGLGYIDESIAVFRQVLTAINAPQATIPEWDSILEAVRADSEHLKQGALGDQATPAPLVGLDLQEEERGQENSEIELDSDSDFDLEFDGGDGQGSEFELGEETSADYEGGDEIAVEVEEEEAASESALAQEAPTKEAPAAAQSIRVTADEELLEVFIEEADELLEMLDQTMMGWGEDPADISSLPELQRTLHTLKGSSRLAGITPIGDLAHGMESLLTELNQQTIPADPSAYDFAQRIADRLAELVESVKSTRRVTPAQDLETELNHWLGLEETPKPAPKPETKKSAQPKATAPTPEVMEVTADPELLEIFLDEATDLLEALDSTLQEWGKSPGDTGPLAELQRTLHTLKGSSRLAGITAVGDLSHAFETFLVEVHHEEIPATAEAHAFAQGVADRLAEQIEEVRSTGAVHSAADMLEALEAWKSGQPVPPAAGAATPKAEAAPQSAAEKPAAAEAAPAKRHSAREQIRLHPEVLDRMVNFAGEISIYRARIEQQNSTLGFNLNELDQTVTRLRQQLRQLEIETEAQIIFRFEREKEESEEEGEDFDPLEFDRFSTMQQLSRSLVETVTDLLSINEAIENLQRNTDTLLLQQSRVSADLQDGLMRTRMVPFSQTVPRLQRVVRQTANGAGKKAELKVAGAEAEIDRNILDRMIGPIEHLLRNSVSHGLESTDQRKDAGKRETGRIHFELDREGNDVVIRVGDDGRGLDLDKIRQKAINRGLLKEGAQVSDEDLTQFVLEHGFSTAEKVDQVAGRGVGMDVVVSEVKQLGGDLHIKSERGKGATFIITLPLTLAVADALLLQNGEEIFAVPHSGMEGVVRISAEDLVACYEGRKEGFEYAGRIYRPRYLGNIMGTANFAPEETRKWYPLLLVRAGDHRLGIHVDELMGNREIVVKSIGPQLAGIRWLNGGTILADGRVALILDITALVRMDAAQTVIAKMQAPEEEETKEEVVTVMVVDDSITVRKVTTRLLQRHGMQVVTAKDGVDAVAKLHEIHPDVMLLDIEMPRMDGYELARHCQHSEELSDIPICMITSRTGEKHKNIALELGVKRYLGKPYQEAQLLETIHELLEERAAA